VLYLFLCLRILYQATDGGTIALDWLMHSDVVEGISQVVNASNPGTDRTPIAIIVPGLTSDSSAAVNFTTPIYFLPLFPLG
jgi:abhydrolase domain-containing protein 1/3